MIINNPVQNTLKLYGDQARAIKKEQRSSGTGDGRSTTQACDEVILSSKAQELGQLQKTMNEIPDVRAERIDQLKQQIQAGNYHVSGTDIAQRLLQSGVL